MGEVYRPVKRYTVAGDETTSPDGSWRLTLLRLADALQLAAGLFVCGDEPATLPIVTHDRFGDAAREGFEVIFPK